MITISILGLDQYITGRLSKEWLKDLADIYEISGDEISFYAPQGYIFHNGIEQTSWNGLIRVHALARFRPFEATVANYLLEKTADFIINASIEFYYVDQACVYQRSNHQYPRFIEEKNIVTIAEDENELGEETETELFEGNIFEEFEKQQK